MRICFFFMSCCPVRISAFLSRFVLHFTNLVVFYCFQNWTKTMGQFFCDSLHCCLDPCHVWLHKSQKLAHVVWERPLINSNSASYLKTITIIHLPTTPANIRVTKQRETRILNVSILVEKSTCKKIQRMKVIRVLLI